MRDSETKRWNQEFRQFMVGASNLRWKHRYPKFRAHSFGDKMEGYSLVKGICEIPKQYAFLTSLEQITPGLIRKIPAKRFVVKDCLGAGGRQVLCIKRSKDEATGCNMYTDLLRADKPSKTCHELVRHIKERMSLTQHLHPSGKPRIIIEEYVRTPDGGIPPDYKVYVVDGKVRGIHLFWKLPTGKFEAAFTNGWERVPLTKFYAQFNPAKSGYHELPPEVIAPSALSSMLPSNKMKVRLLQTATKLAQKHQALFCRYDFYVINQRIILGEITPVCGGIKNNPISKDALIRFFPPNVRKKYAGRRK